MERAREQGLPRLDLADFFLDLTPMIARYRRGALRLALPQLVSLILVGACGSLGWAQESYVAPDGWLDHLNWRSVGPANMSGRITALTVYEKDSTIWWAATASGGLLKTTNDGRTFEHQFDRQRTVSIGDVQVFQQDPNIVWVGTGEGNPRNSSSWGDGVYRSTDGGSTWKHCGLDKIFQTGRIALHPTDPNIAYVGALGRLWGPNEDRGLYKTIDGGETWQKVLYVDARTGVIDVQMHPSDPQTLIVATYERERDGFDGNDPAKKNGPGSGLWMTRDGGATFKRLTQGLPTVALGRIGLSWYRRDPNFVYAVIETERTGQEPENAPVLGIRGEDADVGARLVEVTENGPAAKAGLQVGDILVQVDGKTVTSYRDLLAKVRRFAAESTATLQVVRGRELLELPVTFGKRERPQGSEGAPSREEQAGVRSPFDGGLGGQLENVEDEQGSTGFEFGGVFQSTDGGESWQRINSVNPRPMYYSQIRVDPSEVNHVYVLGTQLYQSHDGGHKFTDDGHGGDVHVDHHALWVDPQDGRRMILGNDGGIYVTRDRMKSWDHLNHVAIGQFYHIGVSSNRDYRIYGGMQDNGSWGGPARVANNSGPVNSDWFRVGGGDGFVCLVDPEDPDQIYFESQNGAMGRSNLRTGERGFIRPRAPQGVNYRFNWKTPFVLSPFNPRIHYSAGNYVFRSVTRGDGIKPISPEITRTDQGSGSAIAESPRTEGAIYVGTTDGWVWVTLDGGQTWTNLFENPADLSIKPEDQGERDGNGDRSGQGRGMNPEQIKQFLSGRDANADGQIQQSEVPERMWERVSRFDSNKDGMISAEELAEIGATPAAPAEGAAAAATPMGETPAPAAAGDDRVSGSWSGKFIGEGLPPGLESFDLTLRLVEGKIAGDYRSPQAQGSVSEGTFNAETGEVSFTIQTEQASSRVTGKIAEQKFTGRIDVNSGTFVVDFEAQRTGDAAAPAAPEAPGTPDGKPLKELVPGPRWVSSLEASRYQDGRVYMTLDGHRSDDLEPYVFVSEDHGKSWRSLRGDLPLEAGTCHVIREDITRPEILYLGCEMSMWVSLDRGQSWRRLQAGFPTVAVHEIAQHALSGDVIVGTHGRSIWIFDATTLRQFDREASSKSLHLFRPNTAVRWRSAPEAGDSGTRRFIGQNSPSGARFVYALTQDVEAVTLVIEDLEGKTLATLTGPATKGLHAVAWDLRREVRDRNGRRGRGPAVPSGRYRVVLKANETESRQVLEVVSDPNAPADAVGQEWNEFFEAIVGSVDEEGTDDDQANQDD